MKRFKHSLSHYKLATFDMGELVPVGFYEVLPGDSVRHMTSALLRVSPLSAPVMHPVSVRIHHWFVPFRLLWTGWEDFITGGPDGLGGSSGVFPSISGSGWAAGNLFDYLGMPGTFSNINALPFRAYQLIWNEFYRDQDIQTAAAVSKASGVDSTTSTALQNVCWEKDYFTSARPWTQKGPAVTLPLGTTAPVNVFEAATARTLERSGPGAASAVNIEQAGGAAGTNLTFQADLSTATAATIGDFRRAMALQKYREARAIYGSRYTEYLRYLGVRSSDSRLQRPEYLGGGKQTISFSEVLATNRNYTDGAFNPDLAGHGISALRSRSWVRFFEEHGLVMTLASVRPRSMYSSGVHKFWTKTSKEDFWQKELERIGQQEVKNYEVYSAHSSGTGVFGYQDRYAEYRSIPSTVSGEFRTSAMNDWHLARIFAADPALNPSFVSCVPSKRVHLAQSNDVLWTLFNHSIQARRLVGRSPGGNIL